MKFAYLAAACLAATSMSGAGAAVRYVVSDIGGSGYTSARGINAAGQVTGSTGDLAFRWSAATGMTDLGDLPGGYKFSYGSAVNAAGEVAGTGYVERGSRAVLWSADGTMTDLGGLAPDRSSLARGINAAGRVVGMADVGGNWRAFIWDAATGMSNIGALVDNPDYGSGATAINDAGQIVGWSNMETGTRTFLWSADDGMIDIGIFDGHRSSYAAGISARGEIVGYSYGEAEAAAFLWTATDGMVNLGDLAGGSVSAAARGINGRGQVVGASDTGVRIGVGEGATGDRAFLWTAAGGMTDLNMLIDPSAGWTLLNANAINDAGQIVGEGLLNGEYRAFILTPDTVAMVPEPAGWAMLILGFGITGLAVRRRRTTILS